MASQPSWRPNLPESRLFEEKTLLQGAILSAVAYGVNLALFILIIPLLIMRVKDDIKHNGRASRLEVYGLLTYVCVMFILSTLSVASEAEVTQLLFIENRDFPGGPVAYHYAMLSTPINSLGYCCFVTMNWLSDVLLLWRCFVLYRSSRTWAIWLVMAMPGLLLLASFATGTIFIEKISRESSSRIKFESIYSTVTLSLNIVLTLMIVIRLYLYRRCLAKLLGRHHASHYTSIISMVIESEAVLVVTVFWFLISLAMRNSLVNIPVFSISQVQTASSYMIIFRVAQGTAWTSQTAYESDMHERQGAISNIRFQTASVEQHPAESRDALDAESNSRDTVYESSSRNPGDASEKARPNNIN